ncbi:MAG: hypothetical protein N2378_04115 [Chloroflexaceae bacterium]|nr:hypothetical protein [Chloroflexaceae bacterium]
MVPQRQGGVNRGPQVRPGRHTCDFPHQDAPDDPTVHLSAPGCTGHFGNTGLALRAP